MIQKACIQKDQLIKHHTRIRIELNNDDIVVYIDSNAPSNQDHRQAGGLYQPYKGLGPAARVAPELKRQLHRLPRTVAQAAGRFQRVRALGCRHMYLSPSIFLHFHGEYTYQIVANLNQHERLFENSAHEVQNLMKAWVNLNPEFILIIFLKSFILLHCDSFFISQFSSRTFYNSVISWLRYRL